MLKPKISTLTEAIDAFFDNALYEADPAVTVIDNGNSEIEAYKSTLEQFMSTAFNDHGEDIANVNIDYNGSDAEILVDVNDKAKLNSLINLYKSKFELEGNRTNSWSVNSVEEVKALDVPCFTIRLTLGENKPSEQVLYQYSIDDIYRIIANHDDAVVAVEDLESKGMTDDLLDLINSKNMRTDDEVLEFITSSEEVEELRNEDREDFTESEHLSENEGYNQIVVSIPMLEDIADTLSSITDYADDGNVSREDPDYSDFFETVDHARELVDDLNYKIADSIGYFGDRNHSAMADESEHLSRDVDNDYERMITGVDNDNAEGSFEDEYAAFDADISDAAWAAVDKLGDGYDYTQDGQGSDYINTFYKDGTVVAEIPDSELKGKSVKEMTSYIVNKIKGIKESKEGKDDPFNLKNDPYYSKLNKEQKKIVRNAYRRSKEIVSLEDLNVSTFDELESALNDLDLSVDLYDECIDIMNDEKAACEKYITDRSEVTNTDDKDIAYLEAQYVVQAIQKMIAASENLDESEKLTEQVVPASELGFKHQELAKIEDEVALISKLKGEDPGNELYTDLLGCFDKAIEILKDAIGEEPVGTVVGQDDVAVSMNGGDNKLGGGDTSDESISDLDQEDIPAEEVDPNLEEPNDEEEEV